MNYRSIAGIAIPVLAASVFFAYGLMILNSGHPDEDAYILFKYANNVAAGEGIAYFPGGPHAEGATDFFFLLCVAFLTWCGIDVAVASVLANAAGAGIFSAVLVRLAKTPVDLLGAALFSIVLLFSSAAAASIAGFSSLFLAGFLSIAILALLKPGRGLLSALPFVCLLLGLTRPDAVLVAVPIALLGIVRARQQGMEGGYYLLLFATGLLGIGYFVWRWQYFGNLLPLPLYVKSHGAGLLPGLELNLEWLKKYSATPLVAIGLFFSLNKQEQAQNRWVPIVLAATLPLFIALMFALQAQNIAYRFQAPVYLTLLLGCFVLTQSFTSAKTTRSACLIWTLLAIVIGYSGMRQFNKSVDRLTEPQYIDVFAERVTELLPTDATIALTEAGRLAFWNDARVVDLVGLNTNYTALNEPTAEYIRTINPDLLLVKDKTWPGEDEYMAERVEEIVVELSTEDVESLLVKANARPSEIQSIKTQQALRAALAFLLEYFADYRVFVTLYGDRYNHIYAIKPGRIDIERFVDKLKQAHMDGSERSYMQLATER